MPTQSTSQKTGSLGHSIVETQVKRSKNWIARNLTEDFGIDIELEYAPSEVKGKFVKVQIKSHDTINITTDFVSESLPKSFLRYVYECRVPILLVVVSNDIEKSWYVWLQKWIVDSRNIPNVYDESVTKSLTVTIHRENDFIIGLETDIIKIATWENTTQLYIALRDLANLSLQLYDERLSRLLFGYLETCNAANIVDTNFLDTIIDKVIELGTAIWATPDGNEVSRMLFNFVREHGDKLNATHVRKLVTRGDDCSRIGIIALSILYDQFPNYTASLNLIKKFEDFSDPRLHFYCTLRERFLGQKSPSWMTDTNDLTVGNMKLDLSSLKGWVLGKWANRGDSMVWDYVGEVE